MSVVDTGLIGACPDLLLSSQEVWGLNNPETARSKTGTLELLTSDVNKTDLDITYMDQDMGHLKAARVQYKTRLTSEDVASTPDESCANGTPRNRKVANVDLDIYKEVKIGISRDKLRTYCEEASRIASNPMAFKTTPIAPVFAETQREINLAMNALRGSINSAILTKIASAFGVHVGGDETATSIQVLANAGTGIIAETPVFEGINQILFDFANAEQNGTPLIAGLGNFFRFDNAVKLAGGLQDSGLDFSKMNGLYNFAPDHNVGTALGNANHIVVMAPQSNHVIFWNENAGNFGGNHGSVSYGLLPDPYVNGLVYDVKVKYDDCDKVYTISLSANAGFFNIPSDAYSTYDRLSGVNGLFRYNAVKS